MIEQATQYLQQAEQENERSNYANALTLLEQALPVFETNGLWGQYVKALTQKSECLYGLGSYNDALKTAKEALDVGLLHLEKIVKK
jgi:tetratricopeptide (TPR) repeat protein